MMKHSTIDLLSRRVYARTIPDHDAIAELIRRGIPYPLQRLIEAIILLLVFPERIIVESGGDNWDEPTTLDGFLFSVLYSAWLILPLFIAYGLFLFLYNCYQLECSWSEFPYVKVGLFSIVHITIDKYDFKF